MALNDKQEKFAQAYILHRNATEAAKTAGYAASSAYNQGYRNLQNGEIKERIEELENTLETSVDVITEIEKQYEFAKARIYKLGLNHKVNIKMIDYRDV